MPVPTIDKCRKLIPKGERDRIVRAALTANAGKHAEAQIHREVAGYDREAINANWRARGLSVWPT